MLDTEEIIERKWRDLKLERKIIAYIVRRNYTIVDKLNADVFTGTFYKMFFEIISEKRTNMNKHLLKKVAEQRTPDDDREALDTFIDKIFTTAVKSLDKRQVDIILEELKKLYESRAIINSIGDIVEDIDSFDLDKAKDSLRAALLTESSIVNIESAGDYLEDFDKRKNVIIEFQKNPDISTGVPTGIKKLDKISGGLQKGEFGIVIAPSGVGK